MKTIFKAAAFLAICIIMSGSASAVPTVTINSVAQRWPWNNKVDINYTVTDGQDKASSRFYKIVFTTVAKGVTYTVDSANLRSSADTGTHTATWTLPSGIRSLDCRMSATICKSDVPNGDDYMVVDLTKAGFESVSFEGMTTQAAANTRYNTAEYKTNKLVLRKVPAGGPYQYLWNVGDTRRTDRDYYIGIFPVTQKQYELVGADSGSTPSYCTAEKENNVIAHRPVERVSWDDLRLSTTAATSSIPVVAEANTGTFFQRLVYKTGRRFSFDLPTDMMFEIAARAGVTTYYFWGNSTMDDSKLVCKQNSDSSTVAVGSHDPNNWGLYDVQGNVWEMGLDSFATNWGNESTVGFSVRTNVFAPYYNPESNLHTWLGGKSWADEAKGDESYWRLHVMAGDIGNSDKRAETIGFRVSVVMD